MIGDNCRVAILAQENVDLCRIACALERFRLGRRAYPESLRELVPDFLPVLPPDRIAGQSLRYRRTEDGLLVIRANNNPPDGHSECDA